MSPQRICRRLEDDEPIPEGVPKRYLSGSGYMRLRWKIAPLTYVEAYEHRIVAGAKGKQQVHHLNGVKHDNRPENLQVMAPGDHTRLHNTRVNASEVIRLYQSGLTTTEVGERLSVDPSQVSRILKANHIPTRPVNEQLRIKFDEEQIREWMLSGVSDRSIARWLGISTLPVNRIRRKLGIAPRRQGRPSRSEEGFDGWSIDTSCISPPEFPKSRLVQRGSAGGSSSPA